MPKEYAHSAGTRLWTHLVHGGITAASYTFTGPFSGTVGVTSSNFTATPNGTYTGTITVRASGGGYSNTLVATLSWSGTSEAKTSTITPTSAGTVTLSIAASGGLIGPTTWTYTSNPLTSISVAITTPASGTTQWGTFPVTATASGGTGIARVDFSVDGGQAWFSALASPYSGSINSDQFADGAHTLAARAYDTSGAYADTSISLTFANTGMPAGAIAVAGSSSAVTLNQANKYYYLTGDITSSDIAIQPTADNITIDLNGHTITYDDIAPLPAFANPGFEAGDASGWDVTDAPSAAVVSTAPPDGCGMYGDWMLKIGPTTGTESILSSAITLPTAGIPYAVGMMLRANYFPSPTIAIVDATTGAVYNTYTQPFGTSGNGIYLANVGTSPANQFVPTSDQLNIRVKITVAPSVQSGSNPITVWLDYLSIARGAFDPDNTVSYIGGIVPGSYGLKRLRVISSQPGGKIVQGQGNSWRAWPYQNHTKDIAENVEFRNLEMDWGGWDAMGIASSASGVVVDGVTMVCSADRQTNRQDRHGCIISGQNTPNYHGARVFKNNIFGGGTQYGISHTGSHSTFIQYLDNDIRQHSKWGDGYSLHVYACQDIEVARNTCIPTSGRGILIEAGTPTPGDIRRMKVHDNFFHVKEVGNAQDGQEQTTAALRIRTYGPPASVPAYGVFDSEIWGNTFWAETGDSGFNRWCAALRLNIQSNHMDDANFIIHDNTFKSILTANTSELLAKGQDAFGLGIGRVDLTHGPGIKFIDNTIESNDNAITWNNTDGTNSHGTLFVRNTVVKSSEGIQPFQANYPLTGGLATTRGFVPWLWTYAGNVDNAVMVDESYTGGAVPGMLFTVGAGYSIQLAAGYLLDLTVRDGSGTPQAGAAVTLRDKTTAVVWTGTTNAAGKIDLNSYAGMTGIPIGSTTYSSDGSPAQNASPVITDNNPFEVSVTSGSLSVTSDPLTISGDQSLTLTVV